MPVGAFVPSRIHLDYPEWQAPVIGNVGQVWAYDGTGYVPTSFLLSSAVSAYGLTLASAADAAAARTALALGTAAVLNVGTGANNVVQLDGSAKLPAVDGSQLTGITVAAAGSDTQVIINDGGVYAGNAGLTYVKATGDLYVTKNGVTSSVFIGGSGNTTATGVQNFGLGQESLATLSSGSGHVAVGFRALKSVAAGSTDVAIGGAALQNTTGNFNVGIGAATGFYQTGGAGNVFIGHSAGFGSGSYFASYNVLVGYQAGYNETGSNRLYLANSNIAKPLVYGEFDNGILKFHSTINTNAVTNTLSLVKRRSSGTAGIGLGVGLRVGLHSSTDEDQDAGRLTYEWVTATHASRASRGKLSAFYTSTEQNAMTWDGDTGGLKLAFYGGTPVAKAAAYTQTYSTADRTLSAYTADDESGAYSGIDNAQAGTVYAQLTDLNALRTAYENLRAFVEDLAQHHNSLLDDMQALNLVG